MGLDQLSIQRFGDSVDSWSDESNATNPRAADSTPQLSQLTADSTLKTNAKMSKCQTSNVGSAQKIEITDTTSSRKQNNKKNGE